jgi:hypothetical protein
MPLTQSDWHEILNKIGSMIGKRGESFVQGVVIKRDEVNKLVWLAEFADTPIPIIGFHHEVEIYDETPKGATTTPVGFPAAYRVRKQKYMVKTIVPQVGEMVLVARYFGVRRLPKCLGVIQSTNYVDPGDE